MAKKYESIVHHGNYRLTKYKGQLIGVEIWPDVEPGETRGYMVWKFAYREPGPVVKLLRRLLRRRGKGGIVARDNDEGTRDS